MKSTSTGICCIFHNLYFQFLLLRKRAAEAADDESESYYSYEPDEDDEYELGEK